MTEEEIRRLFNQARSETSAKEAELTLAFKEKETWVLLFQSKGDELAIRVRETPRSDADSLKEEIRRALARLS